MSGKIRDDDNRKVCAQDTAKPIPRARGWWCSCLGAEILVLRLPLLSQIAVFVHRSAAPYSVQNQLKPEEMQLLKVMRLKNVVQCTLHTPASSPRTPTCPCHQPLWLSLRALLSICVFTAHFVQTV